jgi:signal transduction histidine kinase
VLIQQVLANLLLNGIQAIDIGSSRERDAQRVGHCECGRSRVRRLRYRPRRRTGNDRPAFRPFFTSKCDGIGMGLTVARSIVDAHHGRIWAHGEPGAGCRFSFALPARRPADAADA